VRSYLGFLVLGIASCAPGGAREQLTLGRLAFVAAGPCQVSGVVDCRTRVALLVDRFEVTREAWLAAARYSGSSEFDLPEIFMADWSEATGRWPASGMQFEQARAFADRIGMRLPTVTEWMRIAAGTRGQGWPWGVVDQTSAANTLGLGLRRPAPVGSFENGDTNEGVSDMLGNVAEWVEPPRPVYTVWGPVVGAPARSGAVVPSRASGGTLAHFDHWAMGGSFNDHGQALHFFGRDGMHFNARDLDPRQRSNLVGLRCVADAVDYLWDHAAEWSHAGARGQVYAVGRGWGLPAVGLLEDLAGRAGAPVGLRWLLAGARGE